MKRSLVEIEDILEPCVVGPVGLKPSLKQSVSVQSIVRRPDTKPGKRIQLVLSDSQQSYCQEPRFVSRKERKQPENRNETRHTKFQALMSQSFETDFLKLNKQADHLRSSAYFPPTTSTSLEKKKRHV